MEPAQAAGQHASAGLPVRRGPLEERLLGPVLADRPDTSSARHRRRAILVGLRALRGAVPRRRQAHPRADRRGAQTRRQVQREDEARDEQQGTRAGSQGRGDRESGGDRGWTQHRREYGCAEELSSSRREVHDADAQVQHALVSCYISWVLLWLCVVCNKAVIFNSII